MRAVWTIMLKDIRLRLRSPLALIVYLLFPFVFSGIMALAFGRTDQAPRFSVALVDQDSGPVAGLVRGALGHEKVQRYFEVTEATIVDAHRLIGQNKISGAIVIPEGFSEAIFEGQDAQLGVIKNPAEAIGPLAVEEAAAMIALLLDGAASILAEPLAKVRAGVTGSDQQELSEADVAVVSVLAQRCFQSAQRYVFPPVLRLARASAAPADSAQGAVQPGISQTNLIFRVVLPGMATFALMILALGLPST